MFATAVAATLTALCGGMAGIVWAVRQLAHRVNLIEFRQGLTPGVTGTRTITTELIGDPGSASPIRYINPVPNAHGWGPVVQTDPIRTAQEFGDAT